MKKYSVVLFVFIFIVGSLFGCAQQSETPDPEQISIKATLFYGDPNNETFVTEEREITYVKGEDKYKVIIEELIKGPSNNNFTANIDKDTKVYGTIHQNNHLIVNVSKEFNQFGGSVAEIIGVGSIVNTLTQLDNIESVKILVEGEELIGPSGYPRGFMEPITNIQKTTTEKVTLYFAIANGTAVKGEEREIELNLTATEEQMIQKVLEELIKGPNNPELSPTIPKEVNILSVEIKEPIAYVDFSEEMHTKHWHGAAGEAMTIASIANTLTEFENITHVKMTVAGQPMNIEHAILEKPVGRNEKMIAQ